MTLNSNDLQSDSDLGSICNSCNVLSKGQEHFAQRFALIFGELCYKFIAPTASAEEACVQAEMGDCHGV